MKKMIIAIGIFLFISTFSVAQDIIASTSSNNEKIINIGRVEGSIEIERNLQRLEGNSLFLLTEYSLIPKKTDFSFKIAQSEPKDSFSESAFKIGSTKTDTQPLLLSADAVLGTALEELLPVMVRGLRPENFKRAKEIPIGSNIRMKVGAKGGMIGMVVYW